MGVVEKGNKIFIVADQLTSNEITVEWQQNLRARKEPYYSVEFTNKDQSNEKSVLFIQKDYIDSLRSKKTSGDDFTIIVDEAFQYGQNKERTMRWVVFHDKNRTPFQWRFVSGMVTKYGAKLAEWGGGILLPWTRVDLGKLAGFFGDPLRNF